MSTITSNTSSAPNITWVLVVLACLLGFAFPTTADAGINAMPDDDEFVPFYCGDTPAFDPVGDDQGGHRDIVGDETRPAVLRSASDTHLYLRMRLDDTAQTGDRLRSFGWGYLIDAPPLNYEDGDDSTNTYDYLLHIEGAGGNDGTLRFYSNEGQVEMDDPTAEAAGALLWEYDQETDPFWNVKAAPGTPFGNAPADYFLTIAIAWSDLTPHDVTPDGASVFWAGTSTSNQSLNRDFACHDGDGGGGDPALTDFPSDPAPLDPDEDPCASNTDTCDDNATCTSSSYGDYTCDCDDGFQGDGQTCDPDVPDLQITSPADGASLDDFAVNAVGITDADEDVDLELFFEGQSVDTFSTTADGGGDWSYDLLLDDDGSYTLEAFVENEFGTSATDSVSFGVAGDHCAYDELNSCDENATCNNLSGGTATCDCDDGFQGDGETCDLLPLELTFDGPVDGDSLSNDTPTFEGTGTPGETVEIWIDGELIGTTEVDEDGNWSFTPDEPLDDDTYDISVVIDRDGETVEEDLSFTVDTIAPDISIEAPEDDAILSTSPDEISGETEPDTLVIVYVDGDEIGQTTSDEDGNWTLAPDEDLDYGPRTIGAGAIDAAGNVGTDEIDIVIDPTDPVEITSPDTGDEVRTDTPVVEGTAEPGAEVVITVDGVEVATVTADEDGNWTWTPDEPLDDGEVTIGAESTSEHGITTADSITITIDANRDDVVLSTDDDKSTNDTTPTFEGTAEPGAEVEVIIDGEVVCTATADENGQWSCTPDEELEDGEYTVIANPVDDDSVEGDSIDLTIDTTSPDVTVDYPAEDDLVSTGTVLITGSAEPGSTVEVKVDGEVIGTTRADEDGNWEMEYDADDERTYDVSATATDEAGNSATDSHPFTAVGDYTASGGGIGCASGGSGVPPAGFLVALLLGLVVLRLRRNPLVRHHIATAGIVFAALIMTFVMPSTAHADGFDLQHFHPMPDQNQSFFSAASAEVGEHGQWSSFVMLNQSSNPLVLRNEADDRDSSLVSSQTTLHIMGSVALFDRLEVGLDIPLFLNQGTATDTETPPGVSTVDSRRGLGDIRLVPRGQLFVTDRGADELDFAMAALLDVHLPTGNGLSLQGSDFRAGPTVVFESIFPFGLRTGTHLGYQFRPAIEFENLNINDTLGWGVFAEYTVADDIRLIGEITGRVTPTAGFDPAHSPTEFLVGAKSPAGPVYLTGAVGAGLVRGYGAPDWRAVAGVGIPLRFTNRG